MTAENRYASVIRWSDEDEAFVAVAPEFDGLSGIADTREGALAILLDALESAVKELKAMDEALPSPRLLESYSGQFRVRLPRSLHRRLVEAAEVEGVSLNTLVVEMLSEGLATGNRRAAAPPVTAHSTESQRGRVLQFPLVQSARGF